MDEVKGWVFLSHSHMDVDIVRKIRNRFEEQGFEPLMFYLKCLNDENEIVDLIKREITEREWFIYIDSENSRNSNWVKTERDFISGLENKKVFTINIDNTFIENEQSNKNDSEQSRILNEEIEKQVDNIIRNLSIFISYSSKDEKLMHSIKEKLIEKDFKVITADEFGRDYMEQIANSLEEVSKNGYHLVLLTENAMNSVWIKREIEYVIARGGRTIPVCLTEVETDPFIKFFLTGIEYITMDEEPTEEQLVELVDTIEKYIAKDKSIDFYKTNQT